MRPRQPKQTRQVPEIARFISTNDRARAIYDFMIDAVYVGQVANLDQAILYVKDVSAHINSPVYLGNVTREEAYPIFNFTTRPYHHNV